MTIEILPYTARWPQEFQQISHRLRSILGDAALRIDHIGSTSVPNLAVKDIIDLQITVASFDPAIAVKMAENGFPRVEHINGDHRPPTDNSPDHEWRKWYFQPSAGQRPINMHMRIDGHANQRYALLCRRDNRSYTPSK